MASTAVWRLRNEIAQEYGQGRGPFQVTDELCRHYLKNFSPYQRARSQLQGTLKWRQSASVVEIASDNRLPGIKHAAASGSVLVSDLQDTAGRPILVCFVKNHASTNPAAEINLLIYQMERVAAVVQEASPDGKCTVVVDFEAAEMKNMPGPEWRKMAEILINHYAHLFSVVFAINTNWSIWALVQMYYACMDSFVQEMIHCVDLADANLAQYIHPGVMNRLLQLQSGFDVEDYFAKCPLVLGAGKMQFTPPPRVADVPPSQPVPFQGDDEGQYDVADDADPTLPVPPSPSSSTQDEAAVERLQREIQEYNNDTYVVDENFHLDLPTVHKFLTAYGATEAINAMKRTIDWRKKGPVVELKENRTARKRVEEMSGSGKLWLSLKKYAGTHSILVARPGLQGGVHLDDRAELLNIVYHIERAKKLSRGADLVLVVDLMDAALEKLPDQAQVKRLCAEIQGHYPDCFKHVFVANTPPELQGKVQEVMAQIPQASELSRLEAKKQEPLGSVLAETFVPEEYFKADDSADAQPEVYAEVCKEWESMFWQLPKKKMIVKTRKTTVTDTEANLAAKVKAFVEGLAVGGLAASAEGMCEDLRVSAHSRESSNISVELIGDRLHFLSMQVTKCDGLFDILVISARGSMLRAAVNYATYQARDEAGKKYLQDMHDVYNRMIAHNHQLEAREHYAPLMRQQSRSWWRW